MLKDSYVIDINSLYCELINSDSYLFLNVLKSIIATNLKPILSEDEANAKLTNVIESWTKDVLMHMLSDVVNYRINSIVGTKETYTYLFERSLSTLSNFKSIPNMPSESIIEICEELDYRNGYRVKRNPYDRLRLSRKEIGSPIYIDSLNDYVVDLKEKLSEYTVPNHLYDEYTCFGLEILYDMHSVKISAVGDYRIMEWEREHMVDGKYVGNNRINID